MNTDQQIKKPYYGWRIVATLAVTETISYGVIYYAFTVFLTAMEAELHTSRTEITGAFSLSLLVMGAMAFPVGTWVDKHGARLLMTTGSILASLLLLAWSRVTDLRMLYLIWLGLGVCGACVFYEPAFALVTVWFTSNRARALAVITFAAGFASTIFVPLATTLLTAFGWRTAVVLLAILLSVVTIPLHALFIRRRPADLGLAIEGGHGMTESYKPKHGQTLTQALHSPFFWLLTAAFSLAMLAASAIRVHFIPFLISAGFEPGVAAIASGSIGIFQVAGRVVFAPLERRLSLRTLILLTFALQAVGIMLLLSNTSVWFVALFVMAFGASYGAETLVRVTALADVFGASHYGRISSVMAIFLTVATTAAPVGASVIFDLFKSYTPVLWDILLLTILACVLVWFIQPEPLLRSEFVNLQAADADVSQSGTS